MPEIELSKQEEKKLLVNTIFSSPFMTIIGSVLTTFIIAFIFFKIGGPVPVSISQTTVEKTHTFDVTESVEEEIIPDQAVVNFGINIESSSIKNAQQQANQTINSITDSLKDLGVEENNIKTTSYNIYPSFGDEFPRTYQVNINLQIKVSDFEVLEQAIDTAVSLGATNVGGIRFAISDDARDELEDDLRDRAIKKAKEEAQKIASSADIKLGKIINVVEDQGTTEPPILYDRALTLEAEGAPETQISPGTSLITKTVTLSYETL